MFLENLSYNWCFCTFLYLGLLLGLMYEITSFVVSLTRGNKVIRAVLDVVIVILGFLVFTLAINSLGNGYFRVFFVLGYLLGFYLERISIGFLVAKICLFVYNKSIKILSYLRRKKV